MPVTWAYPAITMEHVIATPFITESEILSLVDGFRARTLPAERWTHHAHLITGLWFNYTYPELEALCYLRSGIINYNVSIGGENTPEKGYHETLTIFWNKILSEFISINRGLRLAELCNTFLNCKWSSKDLPFKYYSKDLLFSLKARATWVEPDLKSLEVG